ncbi:unnamed protein product, partial [Rotaria magnacalcarata]
IEISLPLLIQEIPTYDSNNRNQRQSSLTGESTTSVSSVAQTTTAAIREKRYRTAIGLLTIDKSSETLIGKNENDTDSIDENNWKYYIPFTLEKIRTTPLLKDLIFQYVNYEICYALNRLFRFENHDENEEFLEWFFDEVEYF